MKKLIPFALMCALSLALAGCGSGGDSKEASSAATSSAPAATAATTTSTSAQGAAATTWTEVATVDEAAKGAGLATFGAPGNFTIGDLSFANPKFSYGGGVAQAVYETPATMLTVRKATSTHTAPLSDRPTTDFPQTWTETIDGTNVTMYGAENGAATVFTFVDGSQSYGVTFQGLGGEEMTMDADTVANLVSGIKSVNASVSTEAATPQDTPSQNSQNSTSSQGTQGSQGAQGDAQDAATAAENGYISPDDAKSAAISYLGAGLPEQATAELKVGGDAPHYVVTTTYGNETYTYEIDAITGEIWSQNVSTSGAAANTDATADEAANTSANTGSGELTLTESEAVAIVQQITGGQYIGSDYAETNSYGPCWYVATQDEMGNVYAYYVDTYGNAYSA